MEGHETGKDLPERIGLRRRHDLAQSNLLLYEALVTFEAWGPLGPWVISNST
jgi:hypothetical protein